MRSRKVVGKKVGVEKNGMESWRGSPKLRRLVVGL